MKINKVGHSPSTKGPPETFTGVVRRDPTISSEQPGRTLTGIVTFEPGARTAWHTHPAGQILYILSGCGWVQSDGNPRQQVTTGDSVWFPAGEKHWHGATATTAMAHLAITESIDGSAADWMEHVTDEQYLAG